AISVLGAALAVSIGRNLSAKLGGWYAALAGVGIYLVVVLVALGVMPRYDEVPAEFPASLLYEFRLASVLTQVVLWGVIGVVLAELTHRLASARTPAKTPVASATR
ncbi:MAG: CbtA family protein, partial [Propionibacterium sp.]|nr:CbtA family protein [Propionibacterium sp.]